MKLNEVAHQPYHSNITSWITRAKVLTVSEVTQMLKDESMKDRNWFVRSRGTRLRQLVSEILTLKLKDVSNDQWTESDFEGHQHSDLVTSAINEIMTRVTVVYRQLRIALVSKELKDQKDKNNEEFSV